MIKALLVTQRAQRRNVSFIGWFDLVDRYDKDPTGGVCKRWRQIQGLIGQTISLSHPKGPIRYSCAILADIQNLEA